METVTKTKSQLFAEVLPELEQIEQARKKEASQSLQIERLIGGLIVITVWLLFLFIANEGISFGLFVFGFLFFGYTVTNIFELLTNKKSEPSSIPLDLKQDLGQAIISKVEPDWTFDQHKRISDRELAQSSLLQNIAYHHPIGKDLFTGKYKNTSFQCAQFEYTRDRENGDALQGPSYLFLVADFHKNFKGKTVILPDKAQKTFGAYLGKKIQQFGWKGLELVYMEDPKFEELFAVFGNDQIEARYLLTPKLMEKLVQIKNKFRTNLQVAFTNNKIYIALETPALMDFNVKSPIPLKGTFNHFYNRQKLAKYLMDELCLNDRLWQKE